MEGYPRKDEGCPQLLDLIPNSTTKIEGYSDGRLSLPKRAEQTRNCVSEDKKLELSLGPPGGEWNNSNNYNNKRDHESLISFGYFSNVQNHFLKSPYKTPSYLHQLPVMKESSQPCSNSVVDTEKKAFSAATANNSGSAQKRTAPAPVVGWPPIRSFRKNIANSTPSKTPSDSPNVAPSKGLSSKSTENGPKTLFVKINMDGIPIGRKVDLKAYDSYETLSFAVDELFRGLLAAQSDGVMKDKEDGGKKIGGLLDGSGEYTLVYEDNEGDRMLVGDVPWHMFVSTVKRLRVLKSSELPTLSRGNKQGKLDVNA